MDERRRRSLYVLTDSQVNSIAGATSGVFVSVLVSPLDVVRTRIQVKRLPKGVPDTPLFVTIYRLAKCEGLRVFYKGLGATLLVSSNFKMKKNFENFIEFFRVTYRIGPFISPLINGRRKN